MTTYIYVWLDGKPLGFHDNWGKEGGKAKEFASFGGENLFRCKAWEDAGADTEEEAELLLRHWLALKGFSIGEPIRSIAPPDIMGPHNPHGDWTREKVLPIVLDTLRKLHFAEKDLAKGQWMVGDRPLSVDFDPCEEHGEHFFPVFEEMSKEDISNKVRAWSSDLSMLWGKGDPLSDYGKRMVEKFPATYRAFERAAPSKTQECGVAPPVTLSKEANSMQKPPVDDFISMPEAVELSGYSRRQIVRLCANGDLPSARKLGNRWLVPRQELRDYTPGPKGPVPGKKK